MKTDHGDTCCVYQLDQCLGAARIRVPEQQGLLQQLKNRKLAKYRHWKRRSEGLVMAVTEGEIERKCLLSRYVVFILLPVHILDELTM